MRLNGQALSSEEGGGIKPPGVEQSLAVRSNRCTSKSEGRGGMQRPVWKSEGHGGIKPPGIEQLLAVRWNHQVSKSGVSGEIQWPMSSSEVGSGIEPPAYCSITFNL
jgi:hypothetical protein